MDDFEQKLSALLQDPAQLQSIFALAKSLGLGAPPSPAQADPDPPPQQPVPPPPQDMPPPSSPDAQKTAAFPASALLEAGHLDRRQENLLSALKPFLKPERREKIDRAMQIARLTHLAEFALRGQKEQK